VSILETLRDRKLWIITDYLVVVCIVLLVMVTAIIEPNFLTMRNIGNILRQFGPLAFASLGMTFIIIAGFIDLSIGGMMSFIAIATIMLIDPLGQVAALICGIIIGAICGFLNSSVILKAGALTQAEALFITFGMGTVYAALAMLLSGGATQHLSWCKSDTSMFGAIGVNNIAGPVSLSFLIFVVVLIILHIFQSKTTLGREIFLVGGNKVAARLSGVSVGRSIMTVYIIAGAMSALAAIVLFSRVGTASPTIGLDYQTQAILAVVVGGTTLIGGNGGVLRTVVGALLIILLSNCLNLLGVSVYMQNVASGAILILAIWLDNRKQM